MAMKQIELTDGNKIPQLGLGTWKLTGTECTNIVKKALEIGYRHIDTAEMYGNEEEIGEAIKESEVSRKDLFITSKIWPERGLDYEGVITSSNNSLEKLKTEYLDLYLLHWPQQHLDYEEIFRALRDLKKEGKIKSIGVSNFTVNHLKDIFSLTEKLGLEIIVNQVEFHPLLYQKELLDFCNQH